MAEPAHQLEDDNEPVYDKSGTEPSNPTPNLKALEGGGETSEPKRGHLREAGSDQPSREDLSSAEEGLDEPGSQVNHVYKPDNLNELTKMKPSARGVLGFARANRGKVIIGGSAAGIVALLIIGFLALAPFKILHIVNNLQSHFYASGENAVGKETDNLFSSYVRNYVLPGLNSCSGSTIDKTCTPRAIQGNSLVSKLYQGWTNGHLENTMATKYGMEFKKVGNSFYLKMPGMDGNGANIDSFVHPGQQQLFSLDDYLDKSNDPQFKKVNRNELRQAYQDALGNETKWKQVMYRYKVGGLLSRKYGLKRCVVACTARDNFADWKDNKTQAAKLIIVERVLAPRNQTLGLVIQCVLLGGCDQTQTDSDGRKENSIQAQIQQKLIEAAASEDGKYATVLAHSNGILKDGYKKWLAKQVAGWIVGNLGTKAGTQESVQAMTSDLVPVVGWINGVSNLLGTVGKAPQEIKRLSYITNAASMVGLYTTYRVFADEIKTGNVDPAIVGSFTSQLGSIGGNALGGTASAEQTPLYAQLIGGESAVGSGSKTYKCNDGKTVPAGQQVCPEEVLGNNTGVTNALTNLTNGPLAPLVGLANFWNGTLGKPFKLAAEAGMFIGNFVFKIIPYYSTMIGWFGQAMQPLISTFTDYLIPSPFSDNMGGGRTFDLMAGGADVSGNDYAQNGLGGKALTSQQAAAILTEQNQQNIQEYKTESFFARMFDTSSNYSLVSKIAMATPTGWSSLGQSVGSIFSNPLSKLSNSFGSLFSSGHVFAAAAPQADPFGVTQYGYTDADIQNIGDPETYWDNNCSSDGTTLDWSDNTVNGQWQNSAINNPDPNTGQPENTSTDPCLLIQAAVGSAGAIYNPSLLTPDDLSGLSTSPSNSPQSPSGNAQQLAQQILDENKNGKVQFSGSYVQEDVQDAATGKVGSAGVMTSSALLQLIATIGQSHTVAITAIQSGGTGHCITNGVPTPKSQCPNDPHYNGDAVDFGSLDGAALQGRDNSSLTIMQTAFSVLPGGSGFGQSECGTTPSLPNGDTTFPDSCTHLHVQVPVGTP